MRSGAEAVRQTLVDALPAGTSLCAAFSGGRDSTVLLHALAGLRAGRGWRLRAIHVDHQLHHDAGQWSAHCVDVARRLAVPLDVVRVDVARDGGRGLEAAAREARYGALRSLLRADEWLLTAHHADDQLETVLLHLLRGSGIAGLAGIPVSAQFGPGQLCRPLLHTLAADIAAYGDTVLKPAGFNWLSDPMNADLGGDRAYVRHRIAPVLRGRFPAVDRAFGRSAAHAAEAAGLLDDMARIDAGEVVDGHRLSIMALGRLPASRQRNLLLWLVRERGWAVPPERRLREGLAQLLAAAPGRQPVLAWAGHEVRRYRDQLHLIDVAPDSFGPGMEQAIPWPRGQTLALGGVRGELDLRPTDDGERLAAGLAGELLTVQFRRGGERLRAGADPHHRTLKYLYQSQGIVPWMRAHVPLILAGGRLAAVGDLWIADWAAAAAGEPGFAVVWTKHAPLY